MYDIIIVGSGIVGAACALQLAANSSLNIAVLDAKPHHFQFNANQYADRVSAVSRTSKKLFQKLNVWDVIQSQRISPFTEMHVWDYQEKSHLHFDSESILETELGYIIEDDLIKASLISEFKNFSNIHYACPATPLSLLKKINHMELILDDQSILSTQLLIGADGANSWVRLQAGIDIKINEYGHTAIVASVETEKPHEKTAWQRFLPEGPLAFLPLQNPHACSIVWSAKHEYATDLLALSDDAFKVELEKQFAHQLGRIVSVSKRMHFPLVMRHAKNYVADHVALIGDAAHTIHPLAGLGLNLGLKDAMTLADVILNARDKKRNFAKYYTLRRYERARKSDNVRVLAVVKGLKELFESEKKSVEWARNMGLNILDRLPFLKNYLAEYAGGE